MRPAAGLIAIALSIVPLPGWAQVIIVSPAAGAASSYRTTVISWAPMPGASSYRLQIDDDPNFGSPEVDVIVGGTSYKLSGQQLKLHGQLSWAAYVRLNGVRWNAGTFTPSYFDVGLRPALGVDSHNRVHLAFSDSQTRIHLISSNDWSSRTRLSLEDTFNTYALNLAVDEFDVVHASWIEQRPEESWVPYYTNSSTGWNLVRIPGTTIGGCSEGSLVAGGGQVDLFYDACVQKIERWTTTDGVTFTHTSVPNNDNPTSASAGRDGVGNLYVASERDTLPDQTIQSSLQTSADGWLPHRFGPGRFPSIAVTPGGELHALRWGWDEYNGGIPFFYSNSLRGFQTWTELPVRTTSFDQDLLPLVVNGTRRQLHTALTPADGLRLCSSPHTGLAISTGTSWTCKQLDTVGMHPDVAVAPDGTIHVAWGALQKGLGYANSLGSFLATNFTPKVTFGVPSGGGSTAIIPTTISDPDDDQLSGQIQVGRSETVNSVVATGATTPVVNGRFTLRNTGTQLHAINEQLQFKVFGSTGSYVSYLSREAIPSFPSMIEAKHLGETVGVFAVGAWDDAALAISQTTFVPYVNLPYFGALPNIVDISTVPIGSAILAVAAWDGSTSAYSVQAFTKTPGMFRLQLFVPGP